MTRYTAARWRLAGAGAPRPLLRVCSMRALAAILLFAASLAGCSDDPTSSRSPDSADPGIVHVHGLGRNPTDNSLMIATHTGLFRATAEGEDLTRVADRYQDTMGFTVVGPDHFLGSGHPGSVRDDPPFLGLIESRDAGEHWVPISLRGKVDFHLLEARDTRVYGFGSDFETREPRFLSSKNGGRSWKRLTPPEPLTGLAIDPRNPRHIVALSEQRGYISDDGGSRWRPLAIPGGLITWTSEVGLVAADPTGLIRTAVDPEGRWAQIGNLGGSPAALEAAGDEVLAATHDARILSSRDGGKRWRVIIGK